MATGPGELYDLNADPYERENLFDRPEHRERIDNLIARLLHWQQETDDQVQLPMV